VKEGNKKTDLNRFPRPHGAEYSSCVVAARDFEADTDGSGRGPLAPLPHTTSGVRVLSGSVRKNQDTTRKICIKRYKLSRTHRRVECGLINLDAQEKRKRFDHKEENSRPSPWFPIKLIPWSAVNT